MELIPCMNCVSVGVAARIGSPKSLGLLFSEKIGSVATNSDCLYKSRWLLRGVNLLVKGDDEQFTESMDVLRVLTEFCSAAEPAPTFSEGSALPPTFAEPVGVPGAALP